MLCEYLVSAPQVLVVTFSYLVSAHCFSMLEHLWGEWVKIIHSLSQVEYR